MKVKDDGSFYLLAKSERANKDSESKGEISFDGPNIYLPIPKERRNDTFNTLLDYVGSQMDKGELTGKEKQVAGEMLNHRNVAQSDPSTWKLNIKAFDPNFPEGRTTNLDDRVSNYILDNYTVGEGDQKQNVDLLAIAVELYSGGGK